MDVEITGIRDLVKRLDHKKITKAMNRSINRAAKSTKTEASRLIRKDEGWKIKKKDLDPRIKIHLSTEKKLRAVIFAERISTKTGRHTSQGSFSLTYFGAKEVRPLKGRVRIQTRHVGRTAKRTKVKSGVHVQVKRGGRKAYFSKAFLARMSSGYIGVFRNVEGGKWGGKMHEVKVISAGTMFRKIKPRLEKYASKIVMKELKHNLNRALMRGSKRVA